MRFHFDAIRPPPELGVLSAVFLKQEPGLRRATANLTSKTALTDAVENAERTRFEGFAKTATAGRRVIVAISLG